MIFSDFFNPIKQQKTLFLVLFVFLYTISFLGINAIPQQQKTTLFFTVKPLQTQNKNFALDPVESTTKVAEMISGWAKNPAFRVEVLKKSGVKIPNFKRKISARKQNRMNIFWTLSLYGDEASYSKKIIESVWEEFLKNFEAFNEDNLLPFGVTEPQFFTEKTIFSQWLIACLALFISLFGSLLGLYFRSGISGKIFYTAQINTIFPQSPRLQIPYKIGKHDVSLLESFLDTFNAPKIIGTFPIAEKHFSLTQKNELNGETDTPILLIQLGKTTEQELQNLKSIFGDGVGLVVFEK